MMKRNLPLLAAIAVQLHLLQHLGNAANTTADNAAFVFTPALLQLTHIAVTLSDLSYAQNPLTAAASYDSLQFFNDEPDQALVAAVDGYCFAAFRGTNTRSWSDVYQNFEVGNEIVCTNNDDDVVSCCNVERGFYYGYYTNYKDAFEVALRACAAACGAPPLSATNGTVAAAVCPQVVLTGHSQGGAIAAAAALALDDLSPTVITFGQPPAIDAPCAIINSDKFYRFINSRVGRHGTTYDPVPYLPYNAKHFGHQIMLGVDATGVAYIGKDTQVEFNPPDAANGFASHCLEPADVGYIHRIESLINANTASTVIRSSGFQDGTVCSKNVECDSKICSSERCVR